MNLICHPLKCDDANYLVKCHFYSLKRKMFSYFGNWSIEQKRNYRKWFFLKPSAIDHVLAMDTNIHMTGVRQTFSSFLPILWWLHWKSKKAKNIHATHIENTQLTHTDEWRKQHKRKHEWPLDTPISHMVLFVDPSNFRSHQTCVRFSLMNKSYFFYFSFVGSFFVLFLSFASVV